MYGLTQKDLLTQEFLEQWVAKHKYYQSKLTPGFLSHKTMPIYFCLVVDDFRVKYIGREHLAYLKSVLERHFEISIDWEEKNMVE